MLDAFIGAWYNYLVRSRDSTLDRERVLAHANNENLLKEIAAGDKKRAWRAMETLLKSMSPDEFENPEYMRSHFDHLMFLHEACYRKEDREWPTWVNDYFIKFGYADKFRAKHPGLKCLDIKDRPAPTLGQPGRFYYPTNDGNYRVFDKSAIKKPRVGREYLIWNYQRRKQLVAPSARNLQMMNWYEVLLPEILAEFGLKVKKVPISSNKLDQPVKSSAWLISAGLEEFAGRPLLSFASGAKLKTDLVPRTQLEVAARKFGLNPAQLKNC